MINTKTMTLSVIWFFFIVLVWNVFFDAQPQWSISEKTTYLSYIPPLDIYGKNEPFYHVSLEKLHVFDESTLDDLAKLEQLVPVIDKVLYIPDGFHEYANLNRQGVGKLG